MHRVSIIERAFQVASECGSVQEVRRRLVREGYFQVDAHLTGRQIHRDITSRLNTRLRALENARRAGRVGR